GPYVKSFAIGGVVLILLYFVIKKWTKKRKNLA
ncbi:DedA family protein, partial [Bacillus cereus]